MADIILQAMDGRRPYVRRNVRDVRDIPGQVGVDKDGNMFYAQPVPNFKRNSESSDALVNKLTGDYRSSKKYIGQPKSASNINYHQKADPIQLLEGHKTGKFISGRNKETDKRGRAKLFRDNIDKAGADYNYLLRQRKPEPVEEGGFFGNQLLPNEQIVNGKFFIKGPNGKLLRYRGTGYNRPVRSKSGYIIPGREVPLRTKNLRKERGGVLPKFTADVRKEDFYGIRGRTYKNKNSIAFTRDMQRGYIPEQNDIEAVSRPKSLKKVRRPNEGKVRNPARDMNFISRDTSKKSILRGKTQRNIGINTKQGRDINFSEARTTDKKEKMKLNQGGTLRTFIDPLSQKYIDRSNTHQKIKTVGKSGKLTSFNTRGATFQMANKRIRSNKPDKSALPFVGKKNQFEDKRAKFALKNARL